MEVDPSSNGGHKRSPPSAKGGPTLACSVLVTEQVLASPEFVTTSESLDKPSGESRAPSSPSVEIRHGTLVKCMFNSLDEVSALSAIYAKLLTIAPQELSGEDLAVPSSLALVARESEAPTLNIAPLQAHLPSPYNDLDWEVDELLVDEC